MNRYKQLYFFYGGDMMLDSNFTMPAVDMQQAITDIIESIAMEDAALCKILDSENSILERSKSGLGDLQEFVGINESINSLVKRISMLQLLMQFELENAKELLEMTENLDADDSEE